ncbi:ABC transporter substrate-binding protein [Nocardia speluncae]|uniref:ABC transporter substrate-binding protein n=1 Tax=Nocardia speluncae TaxID=419477 RepID=A0A846XF44_9NOCA|nr:ABC transporter substrate-binding protein [Nocardia speluncae]NKY34678.1 ABC transporter substrate-binding protein [Nocardia speluncae]
MNRSSKLLTALCAAALTTTVAAACVSPGSSTDDPGAGGLISTKAVGGGASMSYTVPQLIDSMDAGTANGLDVTYQGTGTSSSNMVAAVLSGEADFAFPAATTAIDTIQEGGDIVIVAGGLTSASILGLRNDVVQRTGVSAESPVRERIQALRGLKLVTSPEGSGNNTMLRKIIVEGGLDPDKDVEIIGVQDPSAIVGGVKQGRFDGGFYGAGVLEANIADGDAQMWLSTPRGDMDDLLRDQIGMVMVTSKKTLENKPDLVRAMFDTVVDVEESIASDPAAAGELLKNDWFPELDTEVFDLAWEQAQHAYPVDGLVTEAQFDAILDFMTTEDKKYTLEYADSVYQGAR